MNSASKGVEDFLRLVIKHDEIDKVLASIEHQQREDEDTCLTAREIAAHFIVDLYSEKSGDHANMTRITTALDNVADELHAYSKHIKALK